jgi:hypothetical protein
VTTECVLPVTKRRGYLKSLEFEGSLSQRLSSCCQIVLFLRKAKLFSSKRNVTVMYVPVSTRNIELCFTVSCAVQELQCNMKQIVVVKFLVRNFVQRAAIVIKIFCKFILSLQAICEIVSSTKPSPVLHPSI